MSNFKALNTKKYIKYGKIYNEDSEFWKKFQSPTLIKEYGVIDYVDFSREDPYYFAVSSSIRIQVYSPITKLVVKSISRFKENVYGGNFRLDGKLIVAGDEAGYINIFNVSDKNVLRQFNEHKQAVHRVFFKSDLVQIASFSDDKTVKIWDIATGKSINTYNEHNDYIRAGCVHPITPNLIISGGYDNQIKMYDCRTSNSVLSLNHDSPVESLLFSPTGGLLLTAGGTEIRIWDILAGGKLLGKISQHHKTITTIALANKGKHIISGSLDRNIKVYDVSTYKTIHTLHFPNSVLSMSMSPNNQTLVVGMVNGLVSIAHIENIDKDILIKNKKPPDTELINIDKNIPQSLHRKESKYDHWLRKYDYVKALDCVLKQYVVTRAPHITVSVMQDLIHRKGLRRALTGRTHDSIGRIIRFITRYIGELRFTRVLTVVANILLDVYEKSFPELTGKLGNIIIDFLQILQQEEDLTYNLLELLGGIELIISASDVFNNNNKVFEFTDNDSKSSKLKLI